MERESDSLHLLLEHQIILFVIGAVIILSLLLGIGYFIGKWAERKDKQGEE